MIPKFLLREGGRDLRVAICAELIGREVEGWTSD